MGLQLFPLLLVSGVLSAGQTDATQRRPRPRRPGRASARPRAHHRRCTAGGPAGRLRLRAPDQPAHRCAGAGEHRVRARLLRGTVHGILHRLHHARPARLGHGAGGPAGGAPSRPWRTGSPGLATRPSRSIRRPCTSPPDPNSSRCGQRHFGFAKVVHDTRRARRRASRGPRRPSGCCRSTRAIRSSCGCTTSPRMSPTRFILRPAIPWRQGPSESERYDGEIAWVDRQIGRLVDHVRTTRPDAVIVLTADHGEEFGEHGGAYHGTSLFDEQVRVPLLIAAPDLAAYREQRPVSTVDLGAMVESLFDVRSLAARGPEAPSLALPVPEGPVFAELGALKAVVVGPYKAICDFWAASCRLYDTAQGSGRATESGAEAAPHTGHHAPPHPCVGGPGSRKRGARSLAAFPEGGGPASRSPRRQHRRRGPAAPGHRSLAGARHPPGGRPFSFPGGAAATAARLAQGLDRRRRPGGELAGGDAGGPRGQEGDQADRRAGLGQRARRIRNSSCSGRSRWPGPGTPGRSPSSRTPWPGPPTRISGAVFSRRSRSYPATSRASSSCRPTTTCAPAAALPSRWRGGATPRPRASWPRSWDLSPTRTCAPS